MTQKPPHESAPVPQTEFHNSLNGLATHLPEVAAQQEAIRQGGEVLIDELGIQPEFFEDSGRSFFFTALAQRYSSLEERRPGMSVDQYTTEKEFIFDATVLLAGDKSTLFPEVKYLIDSETRVPPETIEAAYKRFTNIPVSKELRAAIDGGLLDDTKERLGITSDNEDPYEVQVLNIADDYNLHGLRRTMPKDLGSKSWNGPEWQDWNQEDNDYKAYANGLKTNSVEFRSQVGMEQIPPAWVSSVNGKTTLNIPLPVAEKILYTDQERAHYYGADDLRRDFAILEHEYTHTQGGANVDNNVFYGIGAEELRAEYFAGNSHGYQNIKGFFLDLTIVTGINVTQYMSQRPKGGTHAELFTMIAQNIGLQNALEIALTAPDTYIDPVARPLQAHVAKYLGGRDALTERIYNQIQADPIRAAEMEARLDQAAQRLAQHHVESWASHRRGMLGLTFITDKIVEHLPPIDKTAQAEKTPVAA